MAKFFSAILLALVFFSSCRYFGGEHVGGSGTIRKETRTAGQFTAIDVSNAIDLYVKQDSTRSVSVETDDNLLEYIKVETEGDKLYIYIERGFNLDPTNSDKVKVYVSSPVFRSLEASGACAIISENMISSDNPIDLSLSGASEATLELKTPKLSADLSGATTISLKGEAREFTVEGSGSSHIKCFDLATDQTKIDVSGATEAEVFANVKLDIRGSGASEISYKGNAAVTQDISGAGTVKKVQ